MPGTAGTASGVRKTVTVVACDLVDSTRLGDRLDPETYRHVLARFYEVAKSTLERHGGTVQRYPGDAVVAAFGVPTLHEDDALRAVSAATELQAALVGLNDQLERSHGVRLRLRMGINTGETAVDDRSLVLGDTVNVAARLQQVAGTGEILIGQRTRDLVRHATTLEPVPRLLLKGKELPVPAWRLLGVTPDPHGQSRRLDTPTVGRDLELAMLQTAYQRAIAERSCHLVVVLGDAGVGKTRLVSEFESQVSAEATVLKGRCPQYGENIDYWPFLQVIRQAAGIRADDPAETALPRLSSLVQGDSAIAGRLAQMLGLYEGTGSPETAAWALGRLVEMLAAFQPIVLVIDDLHWARPKLLDMLEQVAQRTYNAPLLLVCMARSEFRHKRPDWSTVVPNMTFFALTPLNQEQIGQLITYLLNEGDLDPELRRGLAERTHGYPLFAEELVAMLVDQETLRLESGRWTLTRPLEELPTPGSIEMLLAARLEDLSPSEQEVIGTAAVIGQRFLAHALADLVPRHGGEELAIDSMLQSLVRREFLEPDAATIAEAGAAFQFRHPLIQEAAYRKLSKRARADLHQRYAEWLERVRPETVPVEEEVARHLKAAYRFRVELEEAGEATAALQRRTGEWLAAAGGKVALRGDAPETAVRLLTDALDLLPEQHDARLPALLRLAESLHEAWLSSSATEEGRDRIIRAYDAAIQAARRVEDRRIELAARLRRLEVVWFNDLGKLLDPEAELLVAEATQEFEWSRDDLGLARVWHVRAYARAAVGRLRESRHALEHAVRLAQRANDLRLEGRSRQLLCFILDWGPTPAGEVARVARETLAWAEQQVMRSLATDARNVLARAEAMQENFGEARKQIEARNELRRRSSEPLLAVVDEVTDASVDLLADDATAAERILRNALDKLRRAGGKGASATVAALLGRAVLLQGRDDEAEAAARECKQAAPLIQLEAQIRWRLIQAVVLARRGLVRASLRMAREATKLAAQTEQLDTQAQAMYDLAEVLARARRWGVAAKAAARARELWEEKGNLVWARKPQELLEELGCPVACQA